MLNAMNVNLSPALEAKLARLAAAYGREEQSLVEEAIENFVNSDEWLRAEIAEGLAAADRGEFVEHEDVKTLLDRRYGG